MFEKPRQIKLKLFAAHVSCVLNIVFLVIGKVLLPFCALECQCLTNIGDVIVYNPMLSSTMTDTILYLENLCHLVMENKAIVMLVSVYVSTNVGSSVIIWYLTLSLMT